MAIRLNINHGSTKHRFVRLLEAKVTADGADVPLVTAGRDKSRPGALRFDIPDTAKSVKLTVTIPQQTPVRQGVKPTPILEVNQEFKVVADPAPPHLEPVPGFHGRYHARLMETGGTAVSKAGKTRVLNLRLNVTFLNVTQHAIDLGRFGGNPAVPGSLQIPKRTRFRMMEYTRGEPSAWAVLLPSALSQKMTKINTLVFYRPTITEGYRNTDDVDYLFRGRRYLDEPDPGEPVFFSDDGLFLPRPFPDADFERQLVQSKKPVALVFPFPHVTRYGDAANANLVPTLRELVRGLWAEDAVGTLTKEVAPVLGQIGLSGFSNGGIAALTAFGIRANNPNIDELYLFDPARMDKVGPVAAWLAGKRGLRKLRMIGGGYQQDFMIAFARQLNDPANVSVLNNDPNFWYTSTLYQKALSSPQSPNGIDLFDPVGTAPAKNPATRRSALRVVSVKHNPAAPAKSTITLRPEFSNAKTEERTIEGVSHVEAAALIVGHILTNFNSGGKVTTVKELDVVTKMIRLNDPGDVEKDRIKSIRHEWAIAGGEIETGFAPPEPGPRGNAFPGFKGYLQICLERSGFTA